MKKEISLLYLFLVLHMVILTIGTAGYSLIEGWDIVDSFYMTVITITTVGFGETHVLSKPGRIFTIFMIITGVGIMGYSIGTLTQFLVEEQIQRVLGKNRMEKEIQKMEDHFIVCGYGRVGRQVCRELQNRSGDGSVLVVEMDPEVTEIARRDGFVALQDDATSEEGLIRAKIDKAKCLIAAIGSDADNVFITLSARALKQDIFLVVRAETPSSEKKLLQAGANRVISPDLIGGRKMAVSAMHPNIVDFMDIVTLDSQTNYRIEEIVVNQGAEIAGLSMMESDLRRRVGVMIIGIKREHGGLLFNPKPDTVIGEEDILIAVGTNKQLEILGELAKTT